LEPLNEQPTEKTGFRTRLRRVPFVAPALAVSAATLPWIPFALYARYLYEPFLYLVVPFLVAPTIALLYRDSVERFRRFRGPRALPVETTAVLVVILVALAVVAAVIAPDRSIAWLLLLAAVSGIFAVYAADLLFAQSSVWRDFDLLRDSLDSEIRRGTFVEQTVDRIKAELKRTTAARPSEESSHFVLECLLRRYAELRDAVLREIEIAFDVDGGEGNREKIDEPVGLSDYLAAGEACAAYLVRDWPAWKLPPLERANRLVEIRRETATVVLWLMRRETTRSKDDAVSKRFTARIVDVKQWLGMAIENRNHIASQESEFTEFRRRTSFLTNLNQIIDAAADDVPRPTEPSPDGDGAERPDGETLQEYRSFIIDMFARGFPSELWIHGRPMTEKDEPEIIRKLADVFERLRDRSGAGDSPAGPGVDPDRRLAQIAALTALALSSQLKDPVRFDLWLMFRGIQGDELAVRPHPSLMRDPAAVLAGLTFAETYSRWSKSPDWEQGVKHRQEFFAALADHREIYRLLRPDDPGVEPGRLVSSRDPSSRESDAPRFPSRRTSPK
jgi:hypothetical protein